MFKYLCLFTLLSVALSHIHGPFGITPQEPQTSPEITGHLFHGDIKLTPMEEENMEKYGNPYGMSNIIGKAASSDEDKRWPNAIIPYEFDCSVANMESAVSSVKKAMAVWESKTCIRFKKRTTETAYLQFFRGSGCWGHVGHTKNWMSQISIGDNCDFPHVMEHELGHSIGFWHEHGRPDRDNHIRVLWDNVQPGLEDAFTKRTWGTEVVDFGSPYDFASIMHYPFTAFSKNGQPTVKNIVSMNGKTPYVGVSADDAFQTNAMYRCRAVTRKRMLDEFVSRFKPKPQISKRSAVVGTCNDKSTYCTSYKKSGLCEQHADNLLYWCPVTCDMCHSDDCTDKRGHCKAWAAAGDCQSNPTVMKKECPYSCRFCGPNPPTILPTTKNQCGTEPPKTPEPNTPQPPTNPPEPPTPPRPQTPQPQTPQPPTPTTAVGLRCEDKSARCPDYAREGKCETSGWVYRHCLISCEAKCDKEPLKAKGECANAMGLGSWGNDNKLPDSAFTASSILSPGGSWQAAPHSARLYFEDDSKRRLIGAWCPRSRKNEWLKIDLGSVKKLTGIATQGRPVFYEHVRKYELEFSRDGSNWTKYPKVLNGNCDHFTPVLNRFNVQVARYVKIIPNGSQYAWPCLRVELYGCDL